MPPPDDRINPSIESVQAAVVVCERCPRLVEYRREVARQKRAAYRDQVYWGRPVPGFGDSNARVLIIGLAPAAHGGNRTGRMFTGDRSGDFLYAALHRAGFANQPQSFARDDGLALTDVFIAAAARCAPPDNKPTRDELTRCRPFLVSEIKLLKRLQVILALGQIAFEAALSALAEAAVPMPETRPKFGHGLSCQIGPYTLIACYHPSQRNTSTGLVTPAMYDAVLSDVRSRLVDASEGARRV